MSEISPNPRPSSPLIVRPSFEAARRSIVWRGGFPALVLTAIGLASAARSGTTTLLATLGGIAAIATTLVVGAFRYSRSAQISLDERELRLRRWNTEDVVIPRHHIHGVALRELRGPGGRSEPLLIVYGRDGRALAVRDRRLWRDRDIAQLASSLSRGRVPRSRTTTAKKLAAEFPGSMAWWRVHGTLVALSLVVIPTVVTVIVFATVGAH